MLPKPSSHSENGDNDASPAVKPSDTEYQVLIQQQHNAEGLLTELKLLREYQAIKGSFGRGATNLLDALSRGKGNSVPTGARLDGDIEAAEAQLNVIGALLEDWETRQAAWLEESRAAWPPEERDND